MRRGLDSWAHAHVPGALAYDLDGLYVGSARTGMRCVVGERAASVAGCRLQEPVLTANSKPSCVPARAVLPRWGLLGVEVVPYIPPNLRQLSVSQRPLATHSPNVHNGRRDETSSAVERPLTE